MLKLDHLAVASTDLEEGRAPRGARRLSRPRLWRGLGRALSIVPLAPKEIAETDCVPDICTGSKTSRPMPGIR
ncbi:MAG: hypothetical protein HLUCCO07_11670 [Rhodobacteraceae bacterium HLUCCO07]|nr:MAG: hypothetical protein HLUCCO07_11670 [Rhodobacteraceae bacterium HLUCCO07]